MTFDPERNSVADLAGMAELLNGDAVVTRAGRRQLRVGHRPWRAYLLRMKASTTMTRVVVVISPDTTLAQAFDMMLSRRIRHLPVVRDGLLLGILSERDILSRATVKGSVIEAPQTPASEVMSPFPYVCEPTTHVADIVRTMTERKIDAMPVLDLGNRLVGLVTTTDLLLLLIKYDEARPLPFDWQLEDQHVSGAVATA